MDSTATDGKTPSSKASSWNSYVPFFDDSKEEDDENDIERGSTRRSNTTTDGDPPIKDQFRTFWALSAPYFRESGEGRCLFGGLVVLMLLNSATRIVFSYLARDFWSSLGDKDADEFYRVLRNFLIALCLLAPINVLYVYQRQRLAIRWRQWMTDRMLQLYLFNPHRIYYRLEQHQASGGDPQQQPISSTNNNNRVDNPDQRLTEDVRSFTQYSLSLFLTIAISVIDLTAFSVVVYTIEPMLFVSIIGFAAFGTLATCLLGKDLVRLNFQRLSREADFRYSLVRLRENAESIAFFHGESSEGTTVKNRFRRVIENAYSVIQTQRNLEFFTTSYNYLTWILPVVVVAPQYMAGNVELGVVQQAAAAFGNVLDDLSLVINEFEGLSEFSASIGRLHQFVVALKLADPDRRLDRQPLLGHPNDDPTTPTKSDGIFKPRTNPVSIAASSSTDDCCVTLTELPPIGSVASAGNTPALSVRNLNLYTPETTTTIATKSQAQSRRTLIRSLTMDLWWGDRLLIIGPSGIGKSSLLRAIAGLWTSGTGDIQRAHTSDVYFLPQKPYCPIGSLKDQILYPSSSNSDDDSALDPHKLLEILQRVDLPHLAQQSDPQKDPVRGLDAVLDWTNVLSLGEQQRLAFARVLIHQPKLLILDEATSAMDVAAEQNMYSLCQGMTVVSVGHRPTLLQYHNKRLQLHKIVEQDGNTISSCTLGEIHSTEGRVANDEVNLFFR